VVKREVSQWKRAIVDRLPELFETGSRFPVGTEEREVARPPCWPASLGHGHGGAASFPTRLRIGHAEHRCLRGSFSGLLTAKLTGKALWAMVAR